MKPLREQTPEEIEATIVGLYKVDESISELSEDAQGAVWAFLGHGIAGALYGQRERIVQRHDGREVISRQAMLEVIREHIESGGKGPQTSIALYLMLSADTVDYYQESDIRARVAELTRHLANGNQNVTAADLIAFYRGRLAPAAQSPAQAAHAETVSSPVATLMNANIVLASADHTLKPSPLTPTVSGNGPDGPVLV